MNTRRRSARGVRTASPRAPSGEMWGAPRPAASTDDYHRIEVRFTPAPIGSFSSHEVQRKPASDPDAAFQTVGTTTTTTFKDSTELPDGVDFVYRVRGLAGDGNSSWSVPRRRSRRQRAAGGPCRHLSGAGPTLVVAAPGVLGTTPMSTAHQPSTAAEPCGSPGPQAAR